MGGLFTVSSLSRGALQLQFAVGLALLLLAFGIFVFWWRLALRRDFSNRHWWRGFWLLLAGGVSQMIVYLPLTAFLYAGCWIMWTRQGVKEFFD